MWFMLFAGDIYTHSVYKSEVKLQIFENYESTHLSISGDNFRSVPTRRLAISSGILADYVSKKSNYGMVHLTAEPINEVPVCVQIYQRPYRVGARSAAAISNGVIYSIINRATSRLRSK